MVISKPFSAFSFQCVEMKLFVFSRDFISRKTIWIAWDACIVEIVYMWMTFRLQLAMQCAGRENCWARRERWLHYALIICSRLQKRFRYLISENFSFDCYFLRTYSGQAGLWHSNKFKFLFRTIHVQLMKVPQVHSDVREKQPTNAVAYHWTREKPQRNSYES